MAPICPFDIGLIVIYNQVEQPTLAGMCPTAAPFPYHVVIFHHQINSILCVQQLLIGDSVLPHWDNHSAQTFRTKGYVRQQLLGVYLYSAMAQSAGYDLGQEDYNFWWDLDYNKAELPRERGK